uniref:Variant surface glycoprotein 1125.1471 n=1 Tax=Trypanosoma brucei TaxID=5691 RepID=A0A1J0R7E0_9TRYP|nr:variant surface glycoprotein 1125.1471 [Trypanosoma brucei]
MLKRSALVFLWLATEFRQIVGNNEAFKEAAVAKLCTLSKSQKAVSKEVAGGLVNNIDVLTRLQGFGTKLSLLLAVESHFNDATALLLHVNNMLTEAVTLSLREMAALAVNGAAQVAYAAGRIDEVGTLLIQTTHDGTGSNTCIEAQSSNTLNPTTKQACRSTEFKDTEQATNAIAPAAASEVPENGELKGTAKSCVITKDNGGGLVCNTNTFDLKLIDGYYTRTKTQQWGNNERIKTVEDSAALKLAKEVASALKALMEKPQLGGIPSDEQTLTAFINNPNIQEKIAQSLKETKQLSETAGATELAAKINTIFGNPLANGTRPFAAEVAHKQFQS